MGDGHGVGGGGQDGGKDGVGVCGHWSTGICDCGHLVSQMPAITTTMCPISQVEIELACVHSSMRTHSHASVIQFLWVHINSHGSGVSASLLFLFQSKK